MRNPALKILPALMVAITAAWVVTQPVFGGLITTNEIGITENSSTSLIVTYNGSTSGVTVNFLGHTRVGDAWKVTFPSTVSFTSVDNTGVAAFWVEPENSSQLNAGFFHPSSNVAFIFSEHPAVTNPTVPNGTTVTDIGTDTSNGGSISVTFNDKSDVPDTGSTLGLLFVSAIALFGLNRFRHVQLA